MDVRKRSVADTNGRGWLLRLLLLEKAVQHAAVTWAFATDRFEIRESVVVDYRWLIVLGAIAGLLFGVALAAHLAGQPWATWLALGLATFDIVGEFVAQGTVGILITVSFLVATVIFVLAALELRNQPRREAL